MPHWYQLVTCWLEFIEKNGQASPAKIELHIKIPLEVFSSTLSAQNLLLSYALIYSHIRIPILEQIQNTIAKSIQSSSLQCLLLQARICICIKRSINMPFCSPSIFCLSYISSDNMVVHWYFDEPCQYKKATISSACSTFFLGPIPTPQVRKTVTRVELIGRRKSNRYWNADRPKDRPFERRKTDRPKDEMLNYGPRLGPVPSLRRLPI